MNNSKISKDWEVKSKGYEGFLDCLSDMEKRTKCQTVSISDMELLSVLGHNDLSWSFVRHANDGGKVTSKKVDVKLQIPEEMVSEVEAVGSIPLININGKMYSVPMSTFAMRDLADRTGTLCRAIDREGNEVERDRFVVANFRKGKATAVIRSDGKNEKIFAFRGNEFVPIKQTETIDKIVNSLESELGAKGDVDWEINNEISRIVLAFPEKQAEIEKKYPTCSGMVPVVRITSSDIGLSSFRVEAGFKLNHCYMFRPEGTCSFEHNKHFSQKKLENALARKVYPEFLAIPENLERLSKMELKPLDAIQEVFDFTKFESFPGIKLMARTIKEALEIEYALMPSINAKEFVQSLITAPNRINFVNSKGEAKTLADSSIRKLEAILAEAIFCPFDLSKTGIVSALMPA